MHARARKGMRKVNIGIFHDHSFFETTSLTEPEVHQLARLENLPIPTGRIKVGFYVGARESD